jgi:hypothetical protein
MYTLGGKVEDVRRGNIPVSNAERKWKCNILYKFHYTVHTFGFTQAHIRICLLPFPYPHYIHNVQ